MPQILQRASKSHKYHNSANFAVNIMTLRILTQFVGKIENAAKLNLKNATKFKPLQILKGFKFQGAANVLF